MGVMHIATERKNIQGVSKPPPPHPSHLQPHLLISTSIGTYLICDNMFIIFILVQQYMLFLGIGQKKDGVDNG